MYLHPKRYLIKDQLSYGDTMIVSLYHHHVFIKTPWFTFKDFFYFFLIIKSKLYNMVSNITYLEAVNLHIELKVLTTDSIFRARFVRNFTTMENFATHLSLLSQQSLPSLSFSDKLPQCFIRFSMMYGTRTKRTRSVFPKSHEKKPTSLQITSVTWGTTAPYLKEQQFYYLREGRAPPFLGDLKLIQQFNSKNSLTDPGHNCKSNTLVFYSHI